MSRAVANFFRKKTNNADVDNLNLLRIFLTDDARAFAIWRDRVCPSQSEWFQFFNSDEAWQTDPEQWQQVCAKLSKDVADTRFAFSKPLLLLFMCGATRCCEVAMKSLAEQQLVSIREPAGNCLHALVIGNHSRLRPSSMYEALLSQLVTNLSYDQLRSLHVSF